MRIAISMKLPTMPVVQMSRSSMCARNPNRKLRVPLTKISRLADAPMV
jgi:hypothetical protein